MRVDFHTHSTASDGTLTPDELAAAGERAGLSVLALTDHDGVEGAKAFADRSAVGLERCVCGVELSVAAEPHFDKFHLLGLGIDPHDAGLAAFLKKVLAGRNARNEKIIENFNRLGFAMGEEIFAYANGEVLARPHFARWLVERGHAATIPEAFARYLLPTSPKETRCYEERYHPAQEEALGVLHAAGGLCILAHPKYGRKLWHETGPDYAVAERGLSELKEKGLDGIEAFYQANTVDENVTFAHMADRLGLVKSAGSDFHGANKPNISLGMEVETRFIGPLLERLEDTATGGRNGRRENHA